MIVLMSFSCQMLQIDGKAQPITAASTISTPAASAVSATSTATATSQENQASKINH